MPLYLHQLASFPIQQAGPLESVETKLALCVANRPYPMRFVARSLAFDMTPALRTIRDLAGGITSLARAGAPLLDTIDAGDWQQARALVEALDEPVWEQLRRATEPDVLRHALMLACDHTALPRAWRRVAESLRRTTWSLPWLHEHARFYEALEHRHMRQTALTMLAFAPPDVPAIAIANDLRAATGRPVQQIHALPPIIRGPYRQAGGALVPVNAGDPYLAVLLSYDLRGVWDATTLHGLLNLPFDVAIAVDIHTVPTHTAARTAELAYSASRILAQDVKVKDVRGERVFRDSQTVMHALTRWSLHHVQIAVLVSAPTREDLEQHIAQVQGLTNTTLKLARLGKVQRELLKYFTTAPTNTIDAPRRTRNMLSPGLGCILGLVGFHRASGTDGILWGIDAAHYSPLFYDLFKDNQAAHLAILGKTGFGKTVFLNQIALRAAQQGHRVIGIDAFRNGERVEAAAQDGAHCTLIGMDACINPLDIVYDETTEGGWQANQNQHAIGQIAIFLGSPAINADGKEYMLPRAFSPGERGLLDAALSMVYQHCTPDMPLEEMPILSDLIDALEDQDESESREIARELRRVLFGSTKPTQTTLTSVGRTFNVTTTVDWDFSKPINYFDFSTVPDLWRPVFYTQAIGAVLRFMRNPQRLLRDKQLGRKTYLMIDEFGYMTRVAEVGKLAAQIAKVARKYHIGLLAVDQNPSTFLDNENGLFIWENTIGKILFHLDDLPARRVADAISHLRPEHTRFLPSAEPGQCIAVFGNDVYPMTVELNPREWRALRGS